MKRLIILTVFLLSLSSAAFSQTVSVRGIVKSQISDKPLANVSVQITQLRLTTETDDQGAFEFKDIAPGRYTIVTHIDGFSDQARSVSFDSGTKVNIDFSLSLNSLREEVTVTATGTEESVFESFQTVTAVGSTAIREQASTSIGEILERESGVGKRSFGPGTSRPVIRGFDGDRVLVLQDGARTGSVGSQSGDHGEPIDTLNLERLEVIKGPATLLYGSNAIGGVVNAVTSDEDDPHSGFRGFATGLGATVNRQGGAGVGLEYGYKKFLINSSGNFINEGDYSSPLGHIPNSASRSYGGTLKGGYYGKKTFLSAAFNLDRRRYGIPYAPLFEGGSLLTNEDGNPCVTEKSRNPSGNSGTCQYDIFAIKARFANKLPEVSDEAIDIRMRQNNYRIKGGFRDLKGPITQGNFHIDYSDYKHEELETSNLIDTVATTFTNRTLSYRGVLQQAKYKNLSGRFGFEGYKRKFLTVGAEQLVDGKVHHDNFAFFGLEELSFKNVALQFGGRVESNMYDPTNNVLYENRSFTGFSGAAAVRVGLWEGASFVANVTSAYRAPALEELYNNGAHVGTVTFEQGNQNLKRERSNGAEISLRQRLDKIRFNGSVFFYNISNFVFLAPQDLDNDENVDVEGNLPIGNYTQNRAKFVGADLSVDADITDWLGAFVIADVVSAQLRGNGGPLPRITPPRLRAGVDIRYKGLSVRPEVVFTGSRKTGDIFRLETPTAGQSLFNVNASYTIGTTRNAHIFSLSTSNLGNKLYRNHLSFIKDLAPEPGRGLKFSYTFRFF